MKRFTAVRILSSILDDNSLGIFFGDGISKEAFKYDKTNHVYINSEFVSPSFALGVALSTNKKVFAFMDDHMFISNLGDMFQGAVSRCKNLFFVIFISGYYQDHGELPTIFKDISSPKGILFNMGFLIHDYTRYLEKGEKNKLTKIVNSTNGPAAIMVSVDKGLKSDLDEVDYSVDFVKNRLIDFIEGGI